MFTAQSDTFDVPSGLTTILTVRENNSYLRAFCFKNLTGTAISAMIEKSVDGGDTWVVVDTAFTIGAQGEATEIVVKTVEEPDAILRVRCSGGGDDRDVFITYSRMVDEASSGRVWVKPSM